MKSKLENGYRKFIVVWIGQFFSVIGSGLTTFALGYYLYSTTHSVTSYTLVLLCATLPAFLFKPLGGIFADRYNRKSMMILGDFAASIGLLFIFYTITSGNTNLFPIYLGISLSSIFSAFQEPAYKSLVTDLLTEDEYSKASGLVQLASSAQYLISPFLGGILLSIIDIKYIFLIDFTTFIFASFLAFWALSGVVKKPIVDRNNIVTDFKVGIREFFDNRGIFNLVSIITLVMFFVGLLQALIMPMLLQLTSVENAGTIQAICASGMIFGSLFLGLFGERTNQVKMLALGLLFCGIFFAGIGISTGLIFITISGFAFFLTLPFVNTSIEVLIRKNVDNAKQGRVWSIISNITSFGAIFAFVVAGVLADKFFNPLLTPDGLLANSIGTIIGVGGNRGIALIFILAGILLSATSLLISKNHEIKKLKL